jgi:Domain of unknown function (DUF1707)/Cell wall-active antibiotics response 4TMS YvqF
VSDVPEVLASDAERERVVGRLRDASADGRLTLEEFTQRIDRAYEARTRGELDELTRDLPAADTSALPAQPERQRTKRRWVVAVMGNVARRGRWQVGEHTSSITLMGNATIDLREAVLAGPELQISLFCAMGNVHVVVPEGVDVDLGVVAVMGNRFDRRRGTTRPEAPVVRLRGLVLMGNLFVRSSGGEPRLRLPPPLQLP